MSKGKHYIPDPTNSDTDMNSLQTIIAEEEFINDL